MSAQVQVLVPDIMIQPVDSHKQPIDLEEITRRLNRLNYFCPVCAGVGCLDARALPNEDGVKLQDTPYRWLVTIHCSSCSHETLLDDVIIANRRPS